MNRPILFSAAMTKALLAGSKTMSRRVVKPQPPSDGGIVADGGDWAYIDCNGDRLGLLRCPYGTPGDRLWCKESFRWGHAPNDELDQGIVMYDDGSALAHPALLPERRSWAREWRRKPAMYMPRWASRITLEIMGVRVERLQEMTLADWIADFAPTWDEERQARASFTGAAYQRQHSQQLWDSINGKKYPWASNCWVFVISFRRIQP